MKKILLSSILTFVSLVLLAQEPFWEPVEGPYSGSFWASRVMSDGTYYAGSGDGRILRKLPGEKIWRLVATSPDNQTILSFNEYDGWVFAGDAQGIILCSRDNFDSWISVSLDNNSTAQIRSMLVKDDGFYLGTSIGMYKYVYDEVRQEPTWVSTNFTTSRGNFIFSLGQDALGTTYAGTGGGLFSSTDGVTWEPKGFNITSTTIFSIATNNNDIYLGTANGIYVHYETSAEGEWTTLARYITKESFSVRNVSIINGRVFISVTGVGTYYSDDDENWIQMPYQDARAGFFADNDLLIVSTNDGVYQSSLQNPNDNVQKIGTPEKITLLTSVRSKLFAAANRRTLYKSESPREDKTWTNIFKVYNEGSVQCYTEKPDGNRYINLTGSATGAALFGFTILPDQNGYDAIPFPSEVKNLNQFYVTTYDSVLIATNAGIYYFNTYTFEIKRLSKITLTGIEVFEISEDADGNLYAATADGFFVSYDYGKTWPVGKLRGTSINHVYPIGVKEGYVGAAKGLFYFSDLNAEPTPVDGIGSVTDIASDGFGHLYVIDTKTLYYAENKNARWTDVTESLRGLIASDLCVVDNYVYIATDGGLFKHKFAEFADITLTGLGFFTYDGTAKVAGAASNPGGLNIDVTYNKQHIDPLSPGRYKVHAIVNDGVYFGEAFGVITIGGIPAQVHISTTDFVIYDGQPHGATASTDPADLNVQITYNDSPIVPVNAGSYLVKASITGENYSGIAYDTIVIDKAQQFISLQELPRNVLSTDGPLTLTATSSVGLPVRFTVADGPATIQDNSLILNGEEGEILLTALQNGNENYYAANTVMHRIQVWIGTITDAESDLGKALEVFPIPADGDHITLSHKNGKIESFKITDMTGRTMSSNFDLKGSSSIQIPISSYAPGIYVLSVETEQKQRVRKKIEIIR